MYYVLKDKEPVACNAEEYRDWLRARDHKPVYVGNDTLENIYVSTFFLGLDHNFMSSGPPVLFETMVIGGPLSECQRRYSTWDEAEKGHKEMCARVFAADKAVN